MNTILQENNLQQVLETENMLDASKIIAVNNSSQVDNSIESNRRKGSSQTEKFRGRQSQLQGKKPEGDTDYFSDSEVKKI